MGVVGGDGRSIWAPPPRDKLWIRPCHKVQNGDFLSATRVHLENGRYNEKRYEFGVNTADFLNCWNIC